MTKMINDSIRQHIDDLLSRHPGLREIEDQIMDAYLLMERCYANDGKLLIAGNGGSAADAEHIVGELMKSFKMKRPVEAGFADRLMKVDPEHGKSLAAQLEKALPAIALTAHDALSTAYMNDVGSPCLFAQKLYGYGEAGDVFLAISTSGNSENIIKAAVTAKAMGMKVIGLTGEGGGRLSKYADVTVKAPESETYLVQELHLPIYHCWCLMLEERFFGEDR